MAPGVGTDTRHFLFLLVERFTLLAFASALEPLRIANRMAGRPVYDWRVLSVDGAPVTCSAGLAVTPDGGLENPARDSTILVVGGLDVRRAATKPLMTWLRRESRRGQAVGAICTGAEVLARAGLLDGRRATIHWENRASFAEEFPEVNLTHNVFVIDGPRITSSGGTTPSDLMLKLIAQDHGPELANQVADQMIHTSIRAESEGQRLSIPTRIGVRHPKLSAVIERMEAHIEEPISPAVLAMTWA